MRGNRYVGAGVGGLVGCDELYMSTGCMILVGARCLP